MKGICILGSTGSIGVNTLDVVGRHKNKYNVIALTAHRNVDLLYQQCITHEPDYAVLLDPDRSAQLERRLQDSSAEQVKVLCGADALQQVAELPEVDSVMAAIVGAAGLMPTLSAARAGKSVLLANKEALVMSGDLFMEEVKNNGAELIPIDSEHNAIFQCMPPQYRAGSEAREVRRILLTASGGPFRQTSLRELPDVTPKQAVAHPNWVMGQKISVDSATMMNKGLEVIEASLLFGVSAEKIRVVIHPQSVIHSMVDYVDGTVLAQLGNPDMRIPIAYALAKPGRFVSGAEPLGLFEVKHLDFEPPDESRFPCLKLAYDAVVAGGIMPTVLNAANEVAVSTFLAEKIRYTDIPLIIENCMVNTVQKDADSIDTILESDQRARHIAEQYIDSRISV